MNSYESIQTERDYQDRKWGAVSERPHEVGAWLTLMQVHLRRAQEAWASAPNDRGALNELRKVLAIGVACGDQHGLPHRSAYVSPERMRQP
jgi:hypothetical protein